MKQFTDVTFLLDRSGSMHVIKESMEQAFSSFLKEHKVNPSTRITLIQFDDRNDQEVVYQSVPVASAEKLQLNPRGNTPLLDAFVQAIDNTGKRYARLDESERPDQVLFVVITDGQENASKIYKRHDVHKRVTHQRETYNWQFIYLGANQDAIAEAASFGIPQQWAMNYAHTSAGSAGAMAATMSNTVAYASESGARRARAIKSFDPDQRKQAEDKK